MTRPIASLTDQELCELYLANPDAPVWALEALIENLKLRQQLRLVVEDFADRLRDKEMAA